MKLTLVLILAISSVSFATATQSKKSDPLRGQDGSSAVKAVPADTGRLSTNVNFEDQLVNGKYAYPDEAIATVEDEKLLNDLLAVRKNFKDRLKQTALRN